MTTTRPSRLMIFIPFDPAEARAIRVAGRSDRRLTGYAATAPMLAAHGYTEDEREDADYAAQVYASIAGLLVPHEGTGPEVRLVVAADVPVARVGDADGDAEYGAVRVDGLDWAEVTAVFVDEDAAAPAVRAARAAIGPHASDQGGRLATVSELPAVGELTERHELLWHTPDESW